MKVALTQEEKAHLDDIANEVLRYIEEDSFMLGKRDHEYIERRQLFYKMGSMFSKLSYSRLGAYFNQDHATVVNSIKRFDDLRSVDKNLQRKHEDLLIIFKSKFINHYEANKVQKVITEVETNLKKLKKYYYELTNPELKNQENIKEIECEAVQLDASGLQIQIR